MKRSEVGYVKRKLKKLPPLKKRERPFEYRLRDRLRILDVMFVKAKPTRVGLPDRYALGHHNQLFVEIKREGEDLEEHQRVMHAEIHRLTNRRVVVVHGPDVEKSAQFIVRALKTW